MPGRRPVAVRPETTVISVTSNSITVLGNGQMQTRENMFPLGTNLAVRILKPAALSDLRESQWVTVYRAPGLAGPEGMGVSRVIMASDTPQHPKLPGTNDTRSQPPPRMRVSASGELHWEGTNALLKTVTGPLPVAFSQTTRVYLAVPGKLDDVKPGAKVLLDFRIAGGVFSTAGIDVLPPGEPTDEPALRPAQPGAGQR